MLAENLTSIQDRNDHTLTFGYSSTNLTSITDAFGRSVRRDAHGTLVD